MATVPDPPRGPEATRPVSLLVRLLPAAADEGRLAGHAEVVDTSEVVPISDLDDLITLVRRLTRQRSG